MIENYPQGGTARLTQRLRRQLQDMSAASQSLASAVAGNEKALERVALLNRGICAQLHLVRLMELHERLNNLDEIRLERAQVDLVQLGRRLTEQVDAQTRPLLDIRVEFSTSLTALPTLADKRALEEMLLGFFSNAVKAIGRSGSIRLELARQEDRAVFTVTDSGGGMDSDTLSRLFNDEEEEPETPARGLLLARQIVELHGGTLVAGNGERGGMWVAVSIPIVEHMGGMLRSPGLPIDEYGGWSSALVALSDLLPAVAFLPERLER